MESQNGSEPGRRRSPTGWAGAGSPAGVPVAGPPGAAAAERRGRAGHAGTHLTLAASADEPSDCYLFVEPRSTAGRTTVLTTLSPLPRRWCWLVRLGLWLRSRRGPDARMRELSFIHYAHWVLIDRFPLAQRRTRYSYLLFQSSFNGSWGSYLDTFAVLGHRTMALIWGTCFGFPGAMPPGPFRRYIRRNDLGLDHLYCAYPEASATEVAAALAVREQFRALVLPAACADASTLAAAWRQFVHRAQRDL